MLPQDSWLLQAEQAPDTGKHRTSSVSMDAVSHTCYENMRQPQNCGITHVDGTRRGRAFTEWIRRQTNAPTWTVLPLVIGHLIGKSYQRTSWPHARA